ncbi:MAG: hypothetical protein ABSG41_01700 [Bryobacteraceae bacterium]
MSEPADTQAIEQEGYKVWSVRRRKHAPAQKDDHKKKRTRYRGKKTWGETTVGGGGDDRQDVENIWCCIPEYRMEQKPERGGSYYSSQSEGKNLKSL